MLRKILFASVGVLAVIAAIVWWRFGAFNGAPRSLPRDQWEALLRERIKLPDGYQLEVFARDLERPRLMQMTGDGDLIVSGYQGNNILFLKCDADGDGRSDGKIVLKENMQLPHGLLLEGATLYVAEINRVVRYDFDGVKLDNERVIVTGIPAGDGHSSRTLKRGPDGFLYLSIGSSCNACIEEEPWRAAIIRFKASGIAAKKSLCLSVIAEALNGDALRDERTIGGGDATGDDAAACEREIRRGDGLSVGDSERF